jgi:hypothetical protein
MTDWTAGYVADIGYTFGYYQELNPLRAKLAFLNAGLVCPPFGTACELGFGQGLSANLHACWRLSESASIRRRGRGFDVWRRAMHVARAR